jgi:hypothetical protein
MKKIIIIVLLITLGIVIIPQIVDAEAPPIFPLKLNIPIGSVTKVDGLGDYIRIFYEFFVTSAGVLAATMMVIGGYKWATAMGNPSIISGAKEIIMSAVFGLLLALTSYLILYAINPSITSLAPLTIPTLDAIETGGYAKEICDFDTQLNPNKPTEPEPVRCGDTIITNAETGDKCVGLWNRDGDNICVYISSGGAVPVISASEKTEISIQNHTITSQITFDAKSHQGLLYPKDCGEVFWNSNFNTGGDAWAVGAKCDNIAIPGGEDQAERCVMDGRYGDFASDPDVCSHITYNQVHKDGTQLAPESVRSGCGLLLNVYCTPWW